MATNTYFANGYCALMATACDGAFLICNSAVFGSYDDMVACPTGYVLLMFSQSVSALGGTAIVDNKICVAPCETDEDCRAGETDEAIDEVTQYACIDKDGVNFCYDPRNLPESYTADQF